MSTMNSGSFLANSKMFSTVDELRDDNLIGNPFYLAFVVLIFPALQMYRHGKKDFMNEWSHTFRFYLLQWNFDDFSIEETLVIEIRFGLEPKIKKWLDYFYNLFDEKWKKRWKQRDCFLFLCLVVIGFPCSSTGSTDSFIDVCKFEG